MILIGMAIVLLYWAVAAATLIGLGLLISFVWRFGPARSGAPVASESGPLAPSDSGGREGAIASPAVSFWVGLALTLLIVQLWRFAFPVNGYIVGLVLALGAAGWATSWRMLRFSLDWRSAGLIFLGMMWLSNRATGPADQFDAGAYHLPAIQWALAAPEVPGLANLHYRLAFSTLYYGYCSLFEAVGPSGITPHVANSLLVAALMAMQLRAVRRVVWPIPGRMARASDHVLAATMPFSIFLGLSKDIASVNTDVPIFSLGTALTWMLVQLVERRHDRGKSIERAGLASALLIGAASLASIKLTAAPLALGTFVFVAWLSWSRRSWPGYRRALAFGTAFAVTLGGCWLARNVILSGHLLFPVATTRLDVDWAFPERLTQDVYLETSGYPRYELPQTFVGPLLQRIPVGFVQHLGESISVAPDSPAQTKATQLLALALLFFTYGFVYVSVPAGLAIVAYAMAGLSHMKRQRVARSRELLDASGTIVVDAGTLRLLAVAAVPWVINVVYWYWAAPEPRFLSGVAWSFLGLAAATCAVARARSSGPKSALVVLILVAGAVAVIAFRVAYLRINEAYANASLLELVWRSRSVDGERFGLAPAPTPAYREMRNAHGLRYFAADTPLVFWTPVPTDAKGMEGLAPRRPDDLSSGFRFVKDPDSLTSKFAADPRTR